MSLPETLYPSSFNTSAMPDIPIPPMPIKCIKPIDSGRLLIN